MVQTKRPIIVVGVMLEEPRAYDPFPGSTFADANVRNLAALRHLDSMFVYSRLSVPTCSWMHLLLLLYFPIGILLLLLRLLIGFPFTCLLSLIPFPRSWHTSILRWELLFLFGFWVRIKGSPESGTRIYVPNHISEFDAVAIRCVLDPVIFAYAMYEDMWWLKCTPLHIFQMVFVPATSRTEGNVSGRDLVTSKIKDILQNSSKSILVFPEGGLTNTSTGLLQYHKHTFGLGVKMQPIALTAWSPLPLHRDSSYATFLNNLICFLFTPFQVFTVEFLPAMTCDHEESGLSFSRRVMHRMSRHLGTMSSPFLYSDKKKWLSLKKKLRDEGLCFEFVIDEEKQTVEIFKTKKRIGCNSNSKTFSAEFTTLENKLLKCMHDQWGFDNEHFRHLVFTNGTLQNTEVAVIVAENE